MAGRGGFRIDRTTALGALAFLVFGGVFMAVGGYHLAVTARFLREAVPVAAVVVERGESCDSDGCTWRPTLRFADTTGETRMLRTMMSASNYDWPEGHEVTVLHNPAYPYLRVPGFWNLWLFGGAFFVLGALPVGLAFFPLGKLAVLRKRAD